MFLFQLGLGYNELTSKVVGYLSQCRGLSYLIKIGSNLSIWSIGLGKIGRRLLGQGKSGTLSPIILGCLIYRYAPSKST